MSPVLPVYTFFFILLVDLSGAKPASGSQTLKQPYGSAEVEVQSEGQVEVETEVETEGQVEEETEVETEVEMEGQVEEETEVETEGQVEVETEVETEGQVEVQGSGEALPEAQQASTSLAQQRDVVLVRLLKDLLRSSRRSGSRSRKGALRSCFGVRLARIGSFSGLGC